MPWKVDGGSVEDGTAVVRCAGELDVEAAPSLVQAVEDALGSGARAAWLDLRRVTFADSTGVAALIALRRRCHRGRGELHLVLSPELDDLLRTLALRRVFSVHGPDELAAVSSLPTP